MMIIKIKVILTLLFFFITISCSTVLTKSDKATRKIESYIIRDNLLRKTFLLNRAYTSNKYEVFFQLFPKSFKEFKEFYGYNFDTGKQPLYDKYYIHIPFFFNYKGKINDSIFVERIWNITQGAVWEVDAVSMFQDELMLCLIKKTIIFTEIFKKNTSKEMAKFWCFILDGSPSGDKQVIQFYKELHSKIDSIAPIQATLINKEYIKLYGALP